jgi:hypothetical protein
MTARKDKAETAGEQTLDAIGAAMDAAQDAPVFAQEGDVRPFRGEDDGAAEDAPPFPADCPITPLGKDGQTCYYLDWTGQIIALGMGNQHGKNSMIGLFGPRYGWLEDHFTQWSKEKKARDDNGQWVVVEPSVPVGFDQARASKALIVECTRKGIFIPAGRIRGAGAHRGAADALVLHCGDHVMRSLVHINGAAGEIEWYRTGLHGEHVYPAAEAIPRPWHEPVSEADGERALHLLNGWYWRRPQLDPLFMLGGIGASLIGGALGWRGNIWITGGAGTGKSSLNGKDGFLDLLFARGAVRSANTSEAYLRQKMRNSTLPIFLDELEAKDDNRRNEGILELARVSSSGDSGGRGGADHNAVDFTLQSAFWASSILIPPMEPQDRSRWAFCQLMPIPVGAKKPNLKAERLPELGRKLLRRMVDGWHRWDVTFEAYRDALSALGFNARACDQFGTLLCGADLLLYDTLPDEETIESIVSLCKGALREVSDSAPEHELCLNHLRTSMVQSRGGDERESLGTWIGKAVQEIVNPKGEDLIQGFEGNGHRRLQELGLKIVRTTEKGAATWEPATRGYLAVANKHQALEQIFAGKKWAAGVWSQALGYTPGSVEGIKIKFNRVSLTATLVPLEAAIDESEIPQKARWESASEASS